MTSPKRSSFAAVAVAVALAAAALVQAGPAWAGGLYFSDRGVRPLGRAGAFIAGGDDLGAIAYNPAGMYDAGSAFLLDASILDFNSEYTRKALVRQLDPNTGQQTASFTQTFPTVHGTTPPLPIPTLAASLQVGRKLVLAAGAWAPYAAIPSYPSDATAPQRYSLVTLNGSALVFLGGGAAFAPIKELRFGATVGALVGKFNTTTTLSGCVPDHFVCAPEEPSWDVLSELSVGPIIAPTGSAGMTWIPTPTLRIGAAVQLPVYVRAGAKLLTRLPAAPVFENASQDGQNARVAFDLPWSVRAGVETRAIEDLRVELGFGFERWSMHDKITITPDQVSLKNVTGFPATYYVPPIVIPRNLQDSASVRLGAEYALGHARTHVDVRAGVSYESSAVPNDYLSVLTLDAGKVTTAVGVSLHVGKLRLDATYAHVFAFDVSVDPATAKIPALSPLVANPPQHPDLINGGNYSARADVIGLGLAYTFEAAPDDPSAPPAENPAP